MGYVLAGLKYYNMYDTWHFGRDVVLPGTGRVYNYLTKIYIYIYNNTMYDDFGTTMSL